MRSLIYRVILYVIVIFGLYLIYFSHYNDRHLKSGDGYRIPDLIVYNTAANKLVQHENIYEFEEFGRAYTYSPFTAYLLGRIFSNKSFRITVILWENINFIALVLCAVLGVSILKSVFPNASTPGYVVLCSLLLIFRYLNRNFNTGQINIIILAFLLAACLAYIHHHKVLVGLFFGLLLGIKPFLLVFFFLFFLKNREYRLIIASLSFYVFFLYEKP